MNIAQTALTEDASVRPMVAPRGRKNAGLLTGAIALGLGVGLFVVLEARRAERNTPELETTPSDGGSLISAPPPLDIPATFVRAPEDFASPRHLVLAPNLLPSKANRQERLREVRAKRSQSTGGYVAAPNGLGVQQMQGSEAVYQSPLSARPSALDQSTSRPDPDRVKASRFANPATTLPKGAIIQAVLETALNSTQAGAARAIVSRDVRGFDGTRVLIPRGSRLYGEYKADISAGQNRALIQWQRLMRPDGSMIALDSPSADPLGRAGVKGKVNTHFFERFGGAILQSSLDLGANLATRRISNGTVIIGLPGSAQTLSSLAPERVKPTLKVEQGTKVTVFVARDLDFTEVEQ